MENSDKIYLHNQLYTYQHPSVSPKLNITYKILGVVMASVTIYALTAGISEKSLHDIVSEDWLLILYLLLSPFFFFMKEIQEGRQSYLSIDFDEEKVVHKAEGKDKINIYFNELENIVFKTSNITLHLKDGHQHVIVTGNILYKELQKIKTKFELIQGLIKSS